MRLFLCDSDYRMHSNIAGGGKDRVRQGSGVEDGEREGFEGQDIFLWWEKGDGKGGAGGKGQGTQKKGKGLKKGQMAQKKGKGLKKALWVQKWAEGSKKGKEIRKEERA